jgi:hypothetical protein
MGHEHDEIQGLVRSFQRAGRLERMLWALACSGMALAFFLAYTGLGTVTLSGPAGTAFTRVDRLYLALRVFLLEVPDAAFPGQSARLSVALFLAPLSLAGATLLSFLRVLRRTFRSTMFFLGRPEHILICGLSGQGLALTRHFLAQGRKVAVVDDAEDDALRAQASDAGALVLDQDPANALALARARAARAAQVFVVSEQDEKNLLITGALLAQRKAARTRRPQDWHLILRDPVLRDLCARQPDLRGPGLNCRVINVYDRIANALFWLHPADDRDPDGTHRLHLLLLGFGWTGQALLKRALALGHCRTLGTAAVSVLDPEADRKVAGYLSGLRLKAAPAWPPRGPQDVFPAVASRNVQALEDLTREDLEACLATSAAQQAGPFTAVYVSAGTDDTACLRIAAQARRLLDQMGIATEVVALVKNPGLAGTLEYCQTPRFRIHHWEACLLDEAAREEPLARRAQEIHERYRASVQAAPGEQLWAHLDEDLRESNRQSALHVNVMLRGLGLEPADLQGLAVDDPRWAVMAEWEHRRFLAERWLQGWSYGGRKDAEAKLSPRLRLFEELSREDQALNQDYLRGALLGV